MQLPSAGFLSSALGSGLGQLIAAIVGLAAIYKFFIEFVQPDEMAVRTSNNQPDFYHHAMSWTRRIVVTVSTVGFITFTVFAVQNGGGSWYFWLSTVFLLFTALMPPLSKWPLWAIIAIEAAGILAVAVLAIRIHGSMWYYWLTGVVLALSTLRYAISQWPRTDVPALVGPGIKVKIPGWIAYKHAKVAVFTNTCSVPELVDGSGELVNIDVTFDWTRGSQSTRALWEMQTGVDRLIPTHRVAILESAQLLWRSTFGVDNLENSLEGVVREAALEVAGLTRNMAHLRGEEKAEYCHRVLLACEPKFQNEFGATLRAVRLGRTGPQATVYAVGQLTKAVEGLKH